MLGLVAALYDYDWDAAAREFELAMAGDEASSEVRRFRALYYLLPVGRVDEAAAECTRALQQDPLNLLGRVRFAQCLQAGGRDAEAFAELRQVLELDDRLWFSYFILGLEEHRTGELAEATLHAERAFALAPWNPSARGLLAAVCRSNRNRARAEELLATLRPGAYGSALGLATFHMASAEIDESADWTEKAIAERHPAIFFFLRSHGRPLLQSPRWPALARLLSLPVASG
jgi:tetratricopeptide (TPR) repeat protein